MADMHQIAKSFLVSTAQYTKLEREMEKEWKLSLGWFKPSKLIAVTGEAMRDKQKREANQKGKKSKKNQDDKGNTEPTEKGASATGA